jgi:hypothetical protein
MGSRKVHVVDTYDEIFGTEHKKAKKAIGYLKKEQYELAGDVAYSMKDWDLAASCYELGGVKGEKLETVRKKLAGKDKYLRLKEKLEAAEAMAA